MNNTKNLFDFATKELSQDAFLRWFFENYENPELGPIVVAFINYFSKDQFDSREPFHLKYGDIKGLKTYAQRNHIDVSIDFESDQFLGQRTLVIEDKTGSEEHKQLEIYNDVIANWERDNSLPPNYCIYKIFYKTNKIGSDECRRIKEAKWTAFDIYKIFDFFDPYLRMTDSDILNDYIRHIRQIHKDYSRISPEPTNKWNSINWEAFFREFKKNYKGCSGGFFSFQGRYDVGYISFDISGNKLLTRVSLEIRKRDALYPYLHPGFGEKCKWSLNSFKDSVDYETCERELGDLRDFVDKYHRSMIKRANTKGAFGKYRKKSNGRTSMQMN